ncbi:MAG TPA: M56 family metallopeptidase [Acidobacteriaceae bacterium]|nr:M56 family metallopeptidase [Acidobacteriaceae bacterium]
MAPVLDVLHGVSPAAAGVLVASVWQGVLLTGAVGLCFRLVPGVPARMRSAVWTAVLVLILFLAGLSVIVPRTGTGGGSALHLADAWGFGLMCLWGLLSLFRCIQLCLSAARLRVLARSAQPVEVDPAIAPLLQFGRRRVPLCASELVDRPSVVGFLQPRILLSPELLGSLSQPELEQIVLHEMGHLRRGDHWTNLLQQVSLVLLPWNPAVLWLNRRLCFERELACDDRVLRATKARKAYAACLVRLAEDSMLRRGISLTLGALGAFGYRARESELVTRVRRILTTAEPGAAPKFLGAATGAVLAGALAFSVVLARSPRLVQFGSASATVAAASSFEAPALAVNRVNRIQGARPTLAKAVMSVPGGAHAVLTTSVMHKHSVRRRTLRAGQTEPTMQVPVWRDRMTNLRPVVTLTSADDSQQLYAAFPVQGGWILVQL